MIVPIQIREIVKALSQGAEVFGTLEAHDISPIEFFNYLDKNPADKLQFQRARQVAYEILVDRNRGLLEEANDRFELEKAKAVVSQNNWMAEKLIPETYGTKIEHNVNQTINIRAILEEANKRVGAIEVQSKPILEIETNAKEVNHEGSELLE